MDLERDELIPLMYQMDDDTTAKREVFIPPSDQRSRKIMVGAIGYEVPTVDYVVRLEQTVQKQNAQLEELRQHITRLESFMRSTRNFIRKQTGTISDIRGSLDRKLDVREMP